MEDPRFARAGRDPRFMRPKKKVSQVTIDKRFESVFTDQEFTNPCPVDKYGRVKSESENNELKRFYRLESESEDEARKGNDKAAIWKSNSEPGREHHTSKHSNAVKPSESSERIFVRPRKGYDPARGEGIIIGASSSSEQSDSDDNVLLAAEQDEDKDEENCVFEPHPMSKAKAINYGDATQRLALQNMEWDHIEANDLYLLFNSFKPALGSIHSVRVYLSDFGKEQIAKENMYGPPIQIFKPIKPQQKRSLRKKLTEQEDSDSERSSENEATSSQPDACAAETLPEEPRVNQPSHTHLGEKNEASLSEDYDDGFLKPGTNEDFNQDALRQYQLERQRYYYAIVECDSVATASSIYDHCDGREYEKSCNVIDLRYVPDHVAFAPESVVKEATADSAEGARPNEIMAQALHYTNARLTWDEDNPKRVKITRAKFDKETLDKMDFKAYLASDGGSESGASSSDEAGKNMIQKYKSLVNEANENAVFKRPLASSARANANEDDDDVDMEVTFHSGLGAGGALERMTGAAKKAETVFEATLRQQREKRNARKAELKSHTTMEKEKETKSSKAQPSGKRLDKGQSATLELLMMDDETATVSKKHFNLRDIVKQEKAKTRGRGKRNKQEGDDAEGDFSLKVDDARFSAIFDSSHFAIDPSHPSFKDTRSMRKLLEEKRTRAAQVPLE